MHVRSSEIIFWFHNITGHNEIESYWSPEQKASDRREKMNISLLAKLTFVGLGYIYTTKLIDTLYHGIFRPASLAGVVVGLNILAWLFQLLFFFALYRQFVPKDKPALRTGACLAITGSVVGLLPKLLAMALLFQMMDQDDEHHP